MADDKPFASISALTLKEIAQSLMTMKAQATSLSNSASAIIPLTDHHITSDALQAVYEGAEAIRARVDKIYQQIAREAASA